MSALPPSGPSGVGPSHNQPEPQHVPRRAKTYAELGIVVPFLDHLSVSAVPTDDGGMEFVVDVADIHLNGADVTHGGLVMSLLDMAMSAAGRLGDPQQRRCLTVEMKTNFMRPAGRIGDRLSARGTLRQGTRSLAFCDGELRDQHGTLLATASGTFKYRKPFDAGGDA